jgi:hypothetical protein
VKWDEVTKEERKQSRSEYKALINSGVTHDAVCSSCNQRLGNHQYAWCANTGYTMRFAQYSEFLEVVEVTDV